MAGDPAPHSRVADGRTIVWDVPDDAARLRLPAAVDAESIGTHVPSHVARTLSGDPSELLWRWTQLEVAAKLTATPVLLLLRGGVTHTEGIWLATTVVEDLVVSMGWKTADPGTALEYRGT